MDEASNTAASNSGEKQKFFAGSVTFCGQRYTCQCRGSSSKSASAVGVDAVHSRSRRRSVTDVGLPLAGTHRPGSLHRFYENLRRIRGCPRGRQSRRPLQRPLLSPVGADDSVRPQTAPVFTGTFGEFATSSRADVGIGPYIQAAAAYEFAADFRPLLHPRVGGQSRPPLRRTWKSCRKNRSLKYVAFQATKSSFVFGIIRTQTNTGGYS